MKSTVLHRLDFDHRGFGYQFWQSASCMKPEAHDFSYFAPRIVYLLNDIYVNETLNIKSIKACQVVTVICKDVPRCAKN